MSGLNADELYAGLDEKLRDIGWDSGVPEAHGLLTGLACRGFSAKHIGNKMYMFELDSGQDSASLQALYELVLKNLESDDPVFDLMLPGDDESAFRRADEIANWCSGFAQGFCHDGDMSILQRTGPVKEMFDDIMSIARIQTDFSDDEVERQGENRALTEIEQYLRVGIQLIYEEMAVNHNPQEAVPND
ncbi:MAG: UPF0149 family protein [Gammaproteobacteria bacterium]|nr:UPF0149 family protein [Gammaproteobacteria bacterium]